MKQKEIYRTPMENLLLQEMVAEDMREVIPENDTGFITDMLMPKFIPDDDSYDGINILDEIEDTETIF